MTTYDISLRDGGSPYNILLMDADEEGIERGVIPFVSGAVSTLKPVLIESRDGNKPKFGGYK